MEKLSEEDRAFVEDRVHFLGPDRDDKFQLAVLKTGADMTPVWKTLAECFSPGPDDDFDYVTNLKDHLDLPAENIIISVPKDWTKFDVMAHFKLAYYFTDPKPECEGWEVLGSLVVMIMARSGKRELEKCEGCKKDGCGPFEGCLTIPGCSILGRKRTGCVACAKRFYDNGRDKQKYCCSFVTSK